MNIGAAAGLAAVGVGAGAIAGATIAKQQSPFPAESAGDYLKTNVKNRLWSLPMFGAMIALPIAALGAGAQVGGPRALGGVVAAGVGVAALAAGIASYNAVKD